VRQDLLRQHGTRRWTFYTLPAEPPATMPAIISGEPEAQSAQLPAQLSTQLPAQLTCRVSAEQVRVALLRPCRVQSWSAADLATRL